MSTSERAGQEQETARAQQAARDGRQWFDTAGWSDRDWDRFFAARAWAARIGASGRFWLEQALAHVERDIVMRDEWDLNGVCAARVTLLAAMAQCELDQAGQAAGEEARAL